MPLISYMPDTVIGKTPEDKHDSLKVEIKNQPGEPDSKTVSIYVSLFRAGSPEALLKFIVVLHKVIKRQELSTGPQKYGMACNLLLGDSLWVF